MDAPEEAAATPAAVEAGLSLRIAIYGGLLSSLGVTLGWLFWVALQALKRPHGRTEVLLAVIVGAAVGALVEWLREYRADARREKAGIAEAEPAEEKEAEREGQPHYGAALRIGGFTLGFLSLVCEHLVADLIKGVLLPFLTSVATLFPIGAFFALVLEDKPLENPGCNPWGWLGRLLMGALLGLGAAAIAIVLHRAMGQSHDFWSEAGWWVLVGAGLVLVGSTASKPWSPACGVLLAFALMIAVCKWPGPIDFSKGGTPGFFLTATRLVLTKAATGALSAPDLPESSWQKAEEQIREEKEAARKDAAPSGWETDACRWLGCDQLTDENTNTFDLSRWQAPVSYGYHDAGLEPKRRLCADLQNAQGAGLARSWLVMLFFSVGLGLNRLVETRLRPPHYGTSRTRQNDRVLLGIVGAVILAAVLLAHIPMSG